MEQPDNQRKKRGLAQILHTNSKDIMDLNAKCKTSKILGNNIGKA